MNAKEKGLKMINIDELKFDEKGLIPAIVKDAVSGKVLTLAYMNRESLEISMKEEKTLINRALDSFAKKEHRVQQLVPLALVFIFYTGLRIGEVSALR